MDFGFSEEQEMLRKSARDFLAAESPMTYVRRMMEDDRGFTDAQWKQMAELGWMGLILPEQYGGAGGDFVDMVVVLEEMGRAVLPGPFFATVVLGGVALLEGGSDGQKASFLPKIAAGDLRVTLAQLEPNARWDAEGIELQARKDGGGYRLAGTKLFVPDAHTADVIIVAGREPGSKGAEGVTLFLVDAGAEMCGGAQKVLEMSVEYAKVREQFGRPIGSFQAIQHKCANMLVEVESSKSATYYAAWAVANDVAEAPLAAAMAKAYTSDAYRHTAGEGIQIHGGIGFTWEHDMHIYFKRAKSSEVTFGDATWNREIVAQLIGL